MGNAKNLIAEVEDAKLYSGALHSTINDMGFALQIGCRLTHRIPTNVVKQSPTPTKMARVGLQYCQLIRFNNSK